MSPEEVATVTLPCPEPGCEASFTGKATGRGSAAWRLGSHRAQAHGYRNPDGRKKRKPANTADDQQRRPTFSIVTDAAAEVGGRGVPSEAELTRAFGRMIGVASTAAAAYAAETDPALTTEQEKDALVDHLSLDPRSAEGLAKGISKPLAPTGLNKRYGRTIVENVGVVEALSEASILAIKWARYIGHRRAGAPAPVAAAPGRAGGPPLDATTVEFVPQVPVPGDQNVPPPPATATPPPAPAMANGHVAGPPSSGGFQQGHVVTYEEVQRMRSGQ